MDGGEGGSEGGEGAGVVEANFRGGLVVLSKLTVDKAASRRA